MPESWVPVPGYEGIYEVSDQGRVRSLDRIIQHPQGPQHRAGRVLTQDTDRKGYRGVVLCHGEQRRFQLPCGYSGDCKCHHKTESEDSQSRAGNTSETGSDSHLGPESEGQN